MVSVAIAEGASNYHHMTRDVLQYGASMDNNKVSTWPEIYPEIVSLLEGRTIRAFRVDFDSYMIKNSCRAFNLDTAWMETCQWEDMKLFLNSATRIGRELAGELVAKYKKATDEPAQIIPFPAHRWQQFAMME